MATTQGTSPRLHEYDATHIHEDFTDKRLGQHENELFHDCTFKDVRGAVLKDCNLRHSKFVTDKIEDALGLTFTVGECGTFEDVEYSPLLFDLLLVMMLKTKGNDEKRKQILEVLGKERVIELLRQLKKVER